MNLDTSASGKNDMLLEGSLEDEHALHFREQNQV